ncbi:MAG: ABC transporter ATP-binding protein [archaeon]|jgi:branched-chain amino acid transport system ATP-binding protein
MIEIKKLNAGYDNSQVLKDISMRIEIGKVVSIIGPNGAGKSTLLKSIFNQCDIYSGDIIYNGNKITKTKTHKLINLGINYCPQGKRIFNDLTVYENLEIGLFSSKLKEKEKKQLIQEMLMRFPMLKEKENDSAYTLSGGQQQILAIARALLVKPEVLLLDEPSIGLDPKTMKEIFGIVKEINKKDKTTILIVEQNAKQAAEISDKIYIFEDGKVALEGTKEILNDTKIKNIYFGGR